MNNCDNMVNCFKCSSHSFEVRKNKYGYNQYVCLNCNASMPPYVYRSLEKGEKIRGS